MSDNLWNYNGVWLPRGAVVASAVDEHTLRRLELAAQATAARSLGCAASPPRRPQCDSEYLQAFCELLRDHGFNAMGTATFTDKVAARRFVYSPLKAVQVVAQSIRKETPFRGSLGFRGKLFVTPEWHRTGRNVPHLHFALKTTGNPETCCELIRRHLTNTLGWSTCQVMNDVDRATLYGLKDTLKETAFYPNAYFLCLRERGR